MTNAHKKNEFQVRPTRVKYNQSEIGLAIVTPKNMGHEKLRPVSLYGPAVPPTKKIKIKVSSDFQVSPPSCSKHSNLNVYKNVKKTVELTESEENHAKQTTYNKIHTM